MHEDRAGGGWSGLDPRAGTSRDRARYLEELEQQAARGERAAAGGGGGGGARAAMRAAMGTHGPGAAGAAGAGLQMGGAGHDMNARADDDARSLGSGGDPDLTFAGFDAKLFKAEGEAIPLLRPVSQLWASLTGNLGPHDFRPKRAMRISVLAPFFRRDAEFFRQWQLPKGHESRAQATAALVSLLFAGTAMGCRRASTRRTRATSSRTSSTTTRRAARAPSPRRPSRSRASRGTRSSRRATSRTRTRCSRSGSRRSTTGEQTEVVALAVWLFVNDEMHSTSSLVAR